jgi:hypothetical protein
MRGGGERESSTGCRFRHILYGFSGIGAAEFSEKGCAGQLIRMEGIRTQNGCSIETADIPNSSVKTKLFEIRSNSAPTRFAEMRQKFDAFGSRDADVRSVRFRQGAATQTELQSSWLRSTTIADS